MKKFMRTATSMLMCASLLAYTTPLALADSTATEMTETAQSPVSKDESVYVLLNTDGSVQKQIVSNWLHADAGVNTVIDQTTLENIENLKGDLMPEASGSGYVWNTTDTDVFYQGNTDAELPVALDIEYKLDGQTVTGEELAGKTGHVEIHVKVVNQYEHTEEINGVARSIAPVFLTAVLVDMPVDNFSNIETDNGYILNESNIQMVAYATVPGLKNSFDGIIDENNDDYDLSSLTENFSDEFTVSADAVDFELPSIMAVAATDSGVLDSDIDARGNLDNTLSDLSDLTDATLDITDGTRKLYDAAVTFDDSMATFQSKLAEFSDGVDTADSGAHDLADGADELADGAGDLADGASKLSSGASTLANGVASLKDGVGTLSSGASALASGASALATGANTLNTGVGTLATGAGTLSSGASALATGAGTLATGAGAVDAGAQSLSTGAATLYASLSGLNTQLAGMSALISQDEITALSNLAGMLPNLMISDEDRAMIAALPQTVASIPTNMAQAIMNSLYALNGDSIPSAAPTKVPAATAAPTAPGAQPTAEPEATEVPAEPSEAPAATDVPESTEEQKPADAPAPTAETNEPAPVEPAAESSNDVIEDDSVSYAQDNDEVIEQLSVHFDPDMLLMAIASESGAALAQMDTNGDTATASGKLFSAEQMAVIEKVVYTVTANTLEQVNTTMGPVVTKLNGMLSSVDSMTAELANIKDVDQLLTVASQLPDIIAQLNSGVAQLTAGAKQVSDGAATLAANTGSLSAGAGNVASGAGELSTGANSLVAGIGTLSTGAGSLASGAGELSTGANSLVDGVGTLSTGAGKLYSGASTLSDGASTLSDGADSLLEGADTLGSGAKDLASGMDTLNDGASQLSSAINQFKNATSQLKTSTGTLDDGAQEYKTDGIDELTDKLETLIDNVEEALDVKNAIVDCTDGFTTYTGAPAGADTTVKFLFKTPEIKASKAKDTTSDENADSQSAVAEETEDRSMWDKLRDLFK